MNHLAHLFLSFEKPPVMVGNLLGDFVKSKSSIQALPIGIQQGIYLHRHIDTFTDNHEVVGVSKKRFYDDFGKYASVVVDVYYDYCLVKNWEAYSNLPLQEFANFSYQTLKDAEEHLPTKLKKNLPAMIEHNWLMRYGTLEGIQFTFDRLAKRAKYDFNFHIAAKILEENKEVLYKDFNTFFPTLIATSKLKLVELENEIPI